MDWNNDGSLDLLICSEHVILMMNGQDSFGYSHEIVGNLSSCRFLKALDFDSDGDVDLIVDNRYFERIESGEKSKVEERTGVKNPLHILESHHLWAVEDWDGDGDSDLLVARSDDDGLFLIEQLSDGSFREQVENPFRGLFSMQNRYTGPGRNYLADLDGDGLVNLWQMGSWDDCRYVNSCMSGSRCWWNTASQRIRPILFWIWIFWEMKCIGLIGIRMASRTCFYPVLNAMVSRLRSCCGTNLENAIPTPRNGPALRYFQGQEDGSLRQNLSAFEDVDAGAAEIWGLGQN